MTLVGMWKIFLLDASQRLSGLIAGNQTNMFWFLGSFWWHLLQLPCPIGVTMCQKILPLFTLNLSAGVGTASALVTSLAISSSNFLIPHFFSAVDVLSCWCYLRLDLPKVLSPFVQGGKIWLEPNSLFSYRKCPKGQKVVIFVLCSSVCSDQKPTEIWPLSQEVRLETSSNPSSPENCPNKERQETKYYSLLISEREKWLR